MTKHTPKEKAQIIAYFKQHGIGETHKRFPSLGRGTIYYWLEQERKSNGAAPKTKKSTNGVDRSGALIYLEKWRKARLEHIRSGHDTHAYDVFAELALMELQKHK